MLQVSPSTPVMVDQWKNEELTAQLQVMTRHHDEWTTCFEIEAKLPDQPYLGFTAATGDVSDDHEYVYRLSIPS
jgi:hypothetical protein